jgi:hypothetical protein
MASHILGSLSKRPRISSRTYKDAQSNPCFPASYSESHVFSFFQGMKHCEKIHITLRFWHSITQAKFVGSITLGNVNSILWPPQTNWEDSFTFHTLKPYLEIWKELYSRHHAQKLLFFLGTFT